MPHVLFVIDQISSGGAPRSVLKLTQILLQNNIRVSLVSLSDRTGLTIPDGAELFIVPFTPKNRWEKFRRYQLHANKLDEFISEKNVQFDLFVSNLHHSHQVVSRTKLLTNAWLCIRSDPWQELLSNKKGWRRMVKKRKVGKLYSNKRIIALSKTNVESLHRLGSKPIEVKVIPNVLQVEYINELKEEPIAEAHLRNIDFCLFVGRLNFQQKRLDRLLRAYKASEIGLPLILIGEGEKERVKREIASLGLQDSVWLLGGRLNPYPYMKQAKALLLSSDYEGLPNVLLEALACGTPVVSTDCLSGPRDILLQDLARGLVPLNDTDAFGRAIRDVIDNPPLISNEHLAPYSPVAIYESYRDLM